MGLVIFIALAALSILCLIAGFVLLMKTPGDTIVKRGRDAGAEVMAGGLDQEGDEGVGATLLEKQAFRGTGISASRERAISMKEIRSHIDRRDWPAALPGLLLFGGLAGLLVFGPLALFFGVDQVVGVVFILGGWFTAGRMALSFINREG